MKFQREAKAKAQVYPCEVARLEADYRAQERQERPHSRLAKIRRKLASAQKRKARAWRDLKQIQLRIANQQNQMMELQDTLLTLDEWLAYLDADNNDCPYPLQAMLVRYHLPGETRYTTLFYYDEAPPLALPAWFARYNGRQTTEAGIKEGKTVFTLKRHLVRSPIGMQLQEQFALFGANFTPADQTTPSSCRSGLQTSTLELTYPSVPS